MHKKEDGFPEDEWVSAEQFAMILWREFEGFLGRSADLELARRHGWLSPQDVALKDEPLHRNDAARILHEFLRRELGERDEANWDEAKTLKDLYDCRTCVLHVAQVYVKGIMGAEENVFGMRHLISRREAGEIAARAVWKEKRHGGSKAEKAARQHCQAKRLTGKEAAELRASREELLCVDVRTAGEYDAGHSEGFVNWPLMRLMETPLAVSDSKARPILLACDGGYRSEIAAACLESAGYLQVYYYGL